MSKYFRTLSRLQSQQEARAHPADLSYESGEPQGETTEPVAAPDRDFLLRVDSIARLSPAKQRTSLLHLLDHFRAVTERADKPGLVVAGVSGFEPVAQITGGLAQECRARALDVLLGEVSETNRDRQLRAHPQMKSQLPPGRTSGISLSGKTLGEAYEEWLTVYGRQHDLILIKAPPVLQSADAILLGKATAGLALVVKPLSTTRKALRTAVERARVAGCPVVGLVMAGSKKPWPAWFQRVAGSLVSETEMPSP